MIPTVRWTLGPTTHNGRDILKESIRIFSKIYPEFRRVLCHNNIPKKLLDECDVDLFDQQGGDVPIPLRPPDLANSEEAAGCGWKLCPPRLNSDGYELWIDNDIILKKRIPQIDAWLQSQSGLICEGIGRQRMYGEFDRLVPPALHLNAGIFGLPPKYDFYSAIKNIASIMKKSDVGGYDEQGLTASVIANMSAWIIIPQSIVKICEDQSYLPDDAWGYHFVGANRKSSHRAWTEYKNKRMRIM